MQDSDWRDVIDNNPNGTANTMRAFRDLRNEGRVEDGKEPKTTKPGMDCVRGAPLNPEWLEHQKQGRPPEDLPVLTRPRTAHRPLKHQNRLLLRGGFFESRHGHQG